MTTETEAIFAQYRRGEITEAQRDEAVNAIASRGRSINELVDRDAA
jgi:hypothetical protein